VVPGSDLIAMVRNVTKPWFEDY